jgi:signal transduction histidine kinase
MKSKNFFSRLHQFLTPPSPVDGMDQHHYATTNYLAALLMAASILALIPCLMLNAIPTLIKILAGDLVLLVAIIMARRGRTVLANWIILVGLFIFVTLIAFQGSGFHDVALLGLPMIIAMGGLTQGKFSSLIAAGLGTVCLGIIYFGERNGLIPGIMRSADHSPLNDLLITTLLLWITTAFIYIGSFNLIRSLEITRRGEQELRKANEATSHYATALEHRTELLLTGARVSRAASNILDPDDLSQQVVDLVCNRFGLYYVGLFLVEPDGRWATLHAGTGEAGKVMLRNGHQLRIGNTSMVGSCIANKKARIALDVGNEAVRFDNPYLPGTRSELALPLISRGDVIGALSIQSEKEAAFSEEDIIAFQTMGDQLANAIKNSKIYMELESELAQRRHAEKQVRRLNKNLEKRVIARTAELQAANENLIALSHLKDDFLTNVSHELRTPLTSIMLYHSMIESKPEKTSQFMRNLKRETNRLAHLIEDLLFLSRMDRDRIQFNPSGVNLNRLVKEYVTDRAALAAERQLTLKMEPDESLPIIQADEQLVGQVLSILLTNAMNYTPREGRITVCTQGETRQAQAWAGFAVSDNGPGISPEDRKRLFERFYRGKVGRDSATPGTGLGLAIAREIIEKHKGRIEVKSDGPGEGTTFSVWLPVNP